MTRVKSDQDSIYCCRNDKSVIHLDLNPDNIMLGQYGEVTITDW
ncbi:MAG: hypothetical protein ACLFVQ_03330 [Chitinispirillaceae bacterium]